MKTKYKPSGVYTIVTDFSSIKVEKNSLYGVFGIGSSKKGPRNKQVFIDMNKKPKITYTFNKNKKCKNLIYKTI